MSTFSYLKRTKKQDFGQIKKFLRVLPLGRRGRTGPPPSIPHPFPSQHMLTPQYYRYSAATDSTWLFNSTCTEWKMYNVWPSANHLLVLLDLTHILMKQFSMCTWVIRFLLITWSDWRNSSIWRPDAVPDGHIPVHPKTDSLNINSAMPGTNTNTLIDEMLLTRLIHPSVRHLDKLTLGNVAAALAQ